MLQFGSTADAGVVQPRVRGTALATTTAAAPTSAGTHPRVWSVLVVNDAREWRLTVATKQAFVGSARVRGIATTTGWAATP